MKLKKIKVEEPKGLDVVSEKAWCYPTLHLDTSVVPEMKDWEVGEEYEMVIRVKQKSRNESEHHTSGSFDVVAYHVPKEKDIDDMTDEEFGEYQGRALASK